VRTQSAKPSPWWVFGLLYPFTELVEDFVLIDQFIAHEMGRIAADV
jgi:hypothetical protein